MQLRSRMTWVMSLAAAALIGAPVAPRLVAQDSRSATDPSGLFANPPLRYEGSSSSDGFFPYSDADPATAPQRKMLQAAPVASRDREIPTRLPQDDAAEGFPYLTPDVADDEILLGGPKLSAFKSGFFQKLSFGETYLPRWGADGMGISEVETFVTVAVPMPKREWPMLITPYFMWRALDGPTTLEVPANLYETYVDFMWVPRVSPRWTGILAVAPALYSDFESSNQNGFRMTGKALVRYDIVPEKLQLIAGVLYLNRERVRNLPAGGLIWDPNPDTHWEIMFPRPKLSHRFDYGNDWENWFYVSGEFGGNLFKVTLADGTPESLLLYDNRVSIGLEHKRAGGAGARLELGVVFNRSVEMIYSGIEVNPGTTAMLRAVVTF